MRLPASKRAAMLLSVGSRPHPSVLLILVPSAAVAAAVVGRCHGGFLTYPFPLLHFFGRFLSPPSSAEKIPKAAR